MIDLKNTTFMIPIKLESGDRIRNAFTSIAYLINNFDTKVIVKEVDSEKKFTEKVLPWISKFSSKENLNKIKYAFEKSDDPVFYRMQIINEMIAMSDTQVVANYDVDVLLEPDTIVESVDRIMSNKSDVIYPYGGGPPWVYPVPQFLYLVNMGNNLMVEEFIKNDYSFNTFIQAPFITVSHQSYAGHVQFFNKKVYIEGGMENENFKGSSPEDFERIHRFNKLGYRVDRLDKHIYHLEHSRGMNSWPNSVEENPFYKENWALWEYLQTLSLQDLKSYYDDQEYLNKYL